MIKPAFSNLAIDFWIHKGKLGTSQPTLCLSHDEVTVGEPILNALVEIQDEPCPAKRTLTFARCQRKRALSKLTLRCVAESDELRVMCIGYDGDAATIDMTSHGLELLIEAFKGWLDGGEDYGVSPSWSTLKPKQMGARDRQSGELWFWGPSYDP